MRTLRTIRDLAEGGMGRVEIVVQREGAFARAYARKRLLPQLADDGEVREMFLEEGRVAGLVRHANVVPVLDVGEDEEGPFLLMDLIDGVPLGRLIRRSEVGLPVQVTVEIARQIAEGLHAAHELVAPGGTPMALVHRDLSPSNVLVGFDGIVRVTDFGVARAKDRASSSPTVVGKRSYMAPEQRRGEDVDRRADLFSLGVVIAEMLRGAPVLRDPLESPPDPGDERDDLPPELVALCFELTALDRRDRPPSARFVANRLAAIHTALRAEEDAIDLGEIVRTAFAVERAASEREMAEILRDVDPTQLEIALPSAADRTRTRARWAVLAVGSLIGVAVAALTVSSWSDQAEAHADSVPQATEGHEAPEVEAAERNTLEPPEVPEPAVQASEEAHELDPADAAPDELGATEAIPRTRAKTRRARQRRGRREPPPSKTRSEVRTWTWD